MKQYACMLAGTVALLNSTQSGILPIYHVNYEVLVNASTDVKTCSVQKTNLFNTVSHSIHIHKAIEYNSI